MGKNQCARSSQCFRLTMFRVLTMSAFKEQCYCAQRMLNEAKHCFLFCEDCGLCYGHCMGKKKGGTMSTFERLFFRLVQFSENQPVRLITHFACVGEEKSLLITFGKVVGGVSGDTL